MADDLFIHISICGQTKLARCKEQETSMIKLYWRGMLTFEKHPERDNTHEPSSLFVLSHVLFQNIFRNLICLSFLQIAGRMAESCQEKARWKKDYKVISRSTDEQEGETKCPFLSPPNTTFDVSLSSFEHLCSLLNFEHSNDACFNNRSHTV